MILKILINETDTGKKLKGSNYGSLKYILELINICLEIIYLNIYLKKWQK